MHRFFVEPAQWTAADLRLDRAESHHCAHVLRLRPGAAVTVFDGRGTEATAEILATAGAAVRLRVLAAVETPPPPCALTLGQAIPKGRNFDFIVQKATELGASAVVPLLTAHTVPRVAAAEAASKREKWREVAVAAAKQCGRSRLPGIGPPQPLAQFLAAPLPYELALVASLAADAAPFKEVVARAVTELGRRPRSAMVLVGPEGDFTPAELALAAAAGCRPITLGPIVLRVETAALYCLSVLGYELLS